jgi:hypothetical protein
MGEPAAGRSFALQLDTGELLRLPLTVDPAEDPASVARYHELAPMIHEDHDTASPLPLPDTERAAADVVCDWLRRSFADSAVPTTAADAPRPAKRARVGPEAAAPRVEVHAEKPEDAPGWAEAVLAPVDALIPRFGLLGPAFQTAAEQTAAAADEHVRRPQWELALAVARCADRLQCAGLLRSLAPRLALVVHGQQRAWAPFVARVADRATCRLFGLPLAHSPEALEACLDGMTRCTQMWTWQTASFPPTLLISSLSSESHGRSGPAGRHGAT